MNAKVILGIGSMLAGMAIGHVSVFAAEGAQPGSQPQEPAAEGKSLNVLRQDFLKLKFGMFIHFTHLLHTVNARHSNFLLNVGPNKQGRFEEASVKVLAEVGKLHDPAGTATTPKSEMPTTRQGTRKARQP